MKNSETEISRWRCANSCAVAVLLTALPFFGCPAPATFFLAPPAFAPFLFEPDLFTSRFPEMVFLASFFLGTFLVFFMYYPCLLAFSF